MGTAAEANFHNSMRNAVIWLMANNPALMTPVAQTGAKASNFSAGQAQFGESLVDTNGKIVTSITGDLIADGSVDTNHFVDGAVGSDAIDDGAVNEQHLATGSVNDSHVQEQSLSDIHIVPTQSTVASGGVAVNGTTGALQIDLGVSATGPGTGVETVINNDTVNINDGANFSVTGDMTQISNLPATVAAAAAMALMADAQTLLPLATALRQVLRDDGGAFYMDNQYSGGECDATVLGGTNWIQVAGQNLTGSFVTIGNKLQVPNPGTGLPITIVAEAACRFSANGSGGDSAQFQTLISTDGGSTYTSSDCVLGQRVTLTNLSIFATAIQQSLNATPTGDIYIQFQARQSNGTDTLNIDEGFIAAKIYNSSNGSVAGPLIASLKSSVAMSCTSSYPTTTCKATKSLSPTISGGKRPLFYAGSVTGGPGAFLSGASTGTGVIGDTETTTTGGATHATTIIWKITTSDSYAVTAASWAAGVATVTIGTGHNVVSLQTVNGSTFAQTGFNVTNGSISAVTSTQIKYAVAANPGTYTTGGLINNVTTITNTCTLTGTFTLVYPPVSVSVTGGNAKCVTTSGSSCLATGTLTGNPTGGSGTYSTFANSNTGGGGAVLSGATTKSYVVGSSGVVPFGPFSGTFNSVITDNKGNSGNGSKTVTFTGTAV